MSKEIHLRDHEINVSEQHIYAKLLDWSAKVGFLSLIVAFLSYVFDLLPGFTPPGEMNRLWSLSLHSYLSESGMPVGWRWSASLHHGDFASLACVAFLASASLPCLLILMSIYARRRDRLFATICALEIAILALSASGILTAE